MSSPTNPGELAKHRGVYTPSAEAYGGTAGFYTYGPVGAQLKQNIETAWQQRFVTQEGHNEIEAPTVMPEPVFEASGHLDDFDDMLVDCPECGNSHRADHIVEDAPDTDIDEAEGLVPGRIEEIIASYRLECPNPNCRASLVDQQVSGFNLMFGTNIGPGSADPGYLRPETAQGIFVEFPRLKEYSRNQLPFGIAQIGRAYRNEISPRNALVRVREFTQAELEHFVDPERDEPDLESVSDVEIPLYGAEAQQAENGTVQTLTVQEAVDTNLVHPWIGYYLGIARDWYDRIGVDMDRFRYRQHLPNELAHYAGDCWDAEAEVDGDWIEISGFASRGCYDLQKHHNHSNKGYTIFREYDDPKTVERPVVDPDMSVLGPRFGDDAQRVRTALEQKLDTSPQAFKRGEFVTVELDGEQHDIRLDVTGYHEQEQTEHGEHIFPHVVEPSFGIDRLVYTVFAHSLCVDRAGRGETREDRTVLSVPAEVAPTSVGVFPLGDEDSLVDRAHEIVETVRAAGLQTEYDDSGAIGRRYYRQDEVGTPFCVTVDRDGLDDDPETVTLRDRDTAGQVRLPRDRLVDELTALCAGTREFGALLEEYHIETDPRSSIPADD